MLVSELVTALQATDTTKVAKFYDYFSDFELVIDGITEASFVEVASSPGQLTDEELNQIAINRQEDPRHVFTDEFLINRGLYYSK